MKLSLLMLCLLPFLPLAILVTLAVSLSEEAGAVDAVDPDAEEIMDTFEEVKGKDPKHRMIQARGGGVRGAARYYNNRDRGYDYDYDARPDRLNALDSQNDNNRYYDYYNDLDGRDPYYYEDGYYYDYDYDHLDAGYYGPLDTYDRPYNGPGGNPVRNQRARAHYNNAVNEFGIHSANPYYYDNHRYNYNGRGRGRGRLNDMYYP